MEEGECNVEFYALKIFLQLSPHLHDKVFGSRIPSIAFFLCFPALFRHSKFDYSVVGYDNKSEAREKKMNQHCRQ